MRGIEVFHGDWSSTIMLALQPDSSTRFCNDIRKLKSLSIFDAYPLPQVDSLINRVRTARIIKTVDLTKGYWQIPLTESATAQP